MLNDGRPQKIKIWSSGCQWVYFIMLVQMSIKVGVSGSQWVLNDGRPYKIIFYKVWSSGSQRESVGVSGSQWEYFSMLV